MNTQTQEALKMAIEALEQAHSLAFKEIAGSPPDEVLFEDAIQACKEALEQPAQMYQQMTDGTLKALNVFAPSWQGLSDLDFHEAHDIEFRRGAAWAEQILEEKNKTITPTS